MWSIVWYVLYNWFDIDFVVVNGEEFVFFGVKFYFIVFDWRIMLYDFIGLVLVDFVWLVIFVFIFVYVNYDIYMKDIYYCKFGNFNVDLFLLILVIKL